MSAITTFVFRILKTISRGNYVLEFHRKPRKMIHLILMSETCSTIG
jgi:hypothetical protein